MQTHEFVIGGISVRLFAKLRSGLYLINDVHKKVRSKAPTLFKLQREFRYGVSTNV